MVVQPGQGWQRAERFAQQCQYVFSFRSTAAVNDQPLIFWIVVTLGQSGTAESAGKQTQLQFFLQALFLFTAQRAAFFLLHCLQFRLHFFVNHGSRQYFFLSFQREKQQMLTSMAILFNAGMQWEAKTTSDRFLCSERGEFEFCQCLLPNGGICA